MNIVYRANETQPVTFGDLCEALADRELPAIELDGYYVFRRRDLKRFVEAASGEQPPMLLEMFMQQPVAVAG